MSLKSIFSLLCLLAALAGFSVNLVGTLFLADLFFVAGSAWALWFLAGVNIRYLFGALALLVFPPLFLLLDLYNGIPVSDLLRGFSRNFVFVCATVTSFSLALRFGLRRMLILLSISALSYSAAILLGFGSGDLVVRGGLDSFFKYHGLLYGCIILYFFATFSPLLSLLLVALLSAVLIFWLDFRSGAVFLVVPYFFMLVVKASERMGRVLTVLSVLILGVFGAPLLMRFFLDSDRFDQATVDRREQSNMIRAEMAQFAWNEVKAQPFTGFGSWSNANRFVSEFSNERASVHSAFLQYLFEYGIGGFLFILIYFSLAIFAVRGFFSGVWGWRGYVGAVFFSLVFIWVSFVFNLFMGGVLGYTRVIAGCSAGILGCLCLVRGRSAVV